MRCFDLCYVPRGDYSSLAGFFLALGGAQQQWEFLSRVVAWSRVRVATTGSYSAACRDVKKIRCSVRWMSAKSLLRQPSALRLALTQLPQCACEESVSTFGLLANTLLALRESRRFR